MNLMNFLAKEENAGVMLVVSAQDLKDFAVELARRTSVKVADEYRQVTYSAQEVCELLHISRATLANWQKEGKVKVAGKSGNKNVYDKETIDELINKGKDSFVAPEVAKAARKARRQIANRMRKRIQAMNLQ